MNDQPAHGLLASGGRILLGCVGDRSPEFGLQLFEKDTDDVAKVEGKEEEEKFEFTAEGEALGYISLDQAQLLAEDL